MKIFLQSCMITTTIGIYKICHDLHIEIFGRRSRLGILSSYNTYMINNSSSGHKKYFSSKYIIKYSKMQLFQLVRYL